MSLPKEKLNLPLSNAEKTYQNKSVVPVVLANKCGMKEIIAQSGLGDWTHFDLPLGDKFQEMFDDAITNGRVKVVAEDFVKFWHLLDDAHKERRFLVNYLCAVGHIEKMAGTKRPEEKEILTKLISDEFSIFRRLFIEEQRNENFVGVVDRFYKTLICPEREDFRAETVSTYFEEALMAAEERARNVNRNIKWPISIERLIVIVSNSYATSTVLGFVCTYAGWAWMDEANRDRYHDLATYPLLPDLSMIFTPDDEIAKDQDNYLERIGDAVPILSDADRGRVLKAMQKGGGDGNEDYLKRLIGVLGLDRFKTIAFGEASNSG